MATYKGIQGYTVQKLSSDPTASEVEGQLWYNSTSGAFKLGTTSPASFASGGNMVNARYRGGAAGTQTATLAIGGYTPPGGVAKTEEYNGSSWAEGNDLNTGRYILYNGAGTQTAAAYASGYAPTVSPSYNTRNNEYYDGTCWSEKADQSTAHVDAVQFGVQTASFVVAGALPTTTSAIEEWDGSSWTEATALNRTTQELSGTGTVTAGIAAGGSTDSQPTAVAKTSLWNGSAWTESGDLPYDVRYNGIFGTSTACITVGGNSPPGQTNNVTSFDGSTWTEIANYPTVINQTGQGGTTAAGIVFGGGSGVTTTNEWNDPVYTIKTVTLS